MKVQSESKVAQSCLLVTPWTAAHQAPPSMGLSKQEYWSGLSLPSPFKCTVMSDLSSHLSSVLYIEDTQVNTGRVTEELSRGN